MIFIMNADAIMSEKGTAPQFLGFHAKLFAHMRSPAPWVIDGKSARSRERIINHTCFDIDKSMRAYMCSL
jgi:hypothetical protein